MNLIDSESFSLKSVTKDTKAKFDALLKASLLKKSSSSKEKLVEIEIQSISSASVIIPDDVQNVQEVNETAAVDVHSDEKDFIINKFFKENSTQPLPKLTAVKDNFPIPRPRKNVINNEESSSKSSRETYEIKRTNSKDSSRTYKVGTSRNNSPTIEIKNLDVEQSFPRIKENCNTVRACMELQELSHQQKQIRTKEDTISYVDELNDIPKPRTRKFKKNLSTNNEEQETALREYNYENIISIQIIKTDSLKLDSFIIHPVVKIHLVDTTTGKYLLKSSAKRSVLFYYENRDIKYIGPIMTNTYHLQKQKLMYPNWNESLIINEDFNYVMDDTNVIFLFEILDFFSDSNIQEQRGKKDPWHKVAWAFLRHTSPIDGSINVNKSVRLQLYKPGPASKYTPHTHCEVFYWWKNCEWKKYPSSLYIAVQSVKSAQFQAAASGIRSKNPLQSERSQNKINLKPNNCMKSDQGLRKVEERKGNEETKEPQIINSLEQNLNEMQWSRSFYQTCKIPNILLTKLEIPNEGCFLLSFSNNGLLLACGIFINKVYSILIYSVVTFEEKCFFSAHQDYIYSISWSKDDKRLITGSSDWTVCIWDVENKKYVQLLPHPSFVYVSIFSSTNCIATGCYDNTIRIWSVDNKKSYELHQELEGHTGYVTTLCFNKNGNILFSGDSLGVLKTWKIKTGEVFWNLKRDYNILDLKGIAINEIILHPRERRIFIYSRDNYVRLVDLKNSFVMHQFFCGQSTRPLRYFTISPCFTLLFCATDDQGKILIWNINSTKLLASYKPFDNNLPVSCIRFHPFDNIIAISQYMSAKQHVLVYKFNDNSAKKMINLEFYDAGKTVRSSDKNKVPPKKPGRQINFKSDDEEHASAAAEQLENENKEYKKNLREIIEKMDRVIEGKIDILTNAVM